MIDPHYSYIFSRKWVCNTSSYKIRENEKIKAIQTNSYSIV